MGLDFQPIPRIDITAEVIERIKGLLLSGSLQSGARLPPERDLALMLGISRPTLRQSLKVLRAIGVIDSKVGHGTYIRSDSAKQMLEQSMQFLSLTGAVSMAELFEVRRVIEVELTGLAAMRRTASDLAEIKESLLAMSTTADQPDVYVSHNLNFHGLIAKAAKNRLFHAITHNLERIMRESRERTIRVEPRSVLLDDHNAIYQQIEAQNVSGAREAMLKHLERVQHYYSERRDSSSPRILAPGIAL